MRQPPPILSLPGFAGLDTFELFSRTLSKCSTHDVATKAAAVSFYSMIAMVPLLAVVLTIFFQVVPPVADRLIGGQDDYSGAVSLFKEALANLMPGSAFEIVESQISRLSVGYSATIISFSLALAVWNASSVFATICKTMDQIYGRPAQRSFWKLRFTAFFVTLAQAAVMSMALLAFFLWPFISDFIMELKRTAAIHGAFGHKLLDKLPWDNTFLNLAGTLHWLLLSLIVLISFSMLLHIGPSGPRRYPIVTPGALFATPLFLLSTGLFRLYVIKMGSFNQMYGSLGGVMLLLLWFWITGLVLLAGAALDCVILEQAKIESENDD